MALANYTDLVTSIAAWSSRQDLTSVIPDFIKMAESDFNRELRVAQMLVNNPAFPISGEFVNQPTGFLEMRDWYLNVSPRTQLSFLPDEELTTFYDSSGPPKYYSISGNQFRIGPPPDGSYTSTIRYYQAIPPLQTNSVNWLITAHPNLYLLGSLLQSALYAQDDQSIQRWANAYMLELRSVKDANRKMRWGGSGMAVRVA
jgi:hypothetical protein